jgi:hypothetical protein
MKDLRRFQLEVCMENEINKSLTNEPVYRFPTSHRQSIQRRPSGFCEVPIIDKRRQIQDEAIDKRMRLGSDLFSVSSDSDEEVEHPRKLRQCFAE